MATPSSLLKLELIDTGDENSTWGITTNDTYGRIEEAIAGAASITLSNSDVTLSDTDFVSNEARHLVLSLSGTLTADCAVIVPGRSKPYLVVNNCTQSTDYTYNVTIKTSTGTGVVVPAGGRPAWVYCDATNVIAPQVALPHCAISEETEVSLASTTNEVTLAFSSAAIMADPYSMANSGANTVTVPTGAELVSISINAFMTGTIATSTRVNLGIEQAAGSPGTSGAYPFEAIAQRAGSGGLYTPITCSAMFHLPNNLNQSRGTTFKFTAQLDTSTAGVAVSGFEANVCVLR